MNLTGNPEFSKAQSCHRTPTHSSTHSLTHPPIQVGSSWRLRSLGQVALALAFPSSVSFLAEAEEQLLVVQCVRGDQHVVTARWRSTLVRDKFLPPQ